MFKFKIKAVLKELQAGFEAQVDSALQMRGGGVYEVVGPGQGTDDTELTLSLAHSLLKFSPPELPVEAIAA